MLEGVYREIDAKASQSGKQEEQQMIESVIGRYHLETLARYVKTVNINAKL